MPPDELVDLISGEDEGLAGGWGGGKERAGKRGGTGSGDQLMKVDA